MDRNERVQIAMQILFMTMFLCWAGIFAIQYVVTIRNHLRAMKRISDEDRARRNRILEKMQAKRWG